jgi:hypothetical protein
VHVTLRTGALLSATVDDVDRISGNVDTALDFEVLDYSDPCISAAAGLTVEPLPGATFIAVRTESAHDVNDNGNVTCGEVVALAPMVFGAYWAR